MIETLAPRLVPVVLQNLRTQYPYHDMHFMLAADDVHDPMRAHPAFGNSFDWHSSVHSHWTALSLIDYFEEREEAPPGLSELRSVVAEHLSEANLAAELHYLEGRPSYERPYGWAWAMLLATLSPNARTLAEWIAGAAIEWMRALPMPVRHGVHSNTAFALGLMHDAASAMELNALRQTIEERARYWFERDRDWPQGFERSGNDFLSPGLTEADLMRRVLAPDEFARWWSAFLPDIRQRAVLLAPAAVPHVSDGHIVHLHGLNISRAAQLARIGLELRRAELLDAARSLYESSVERAVGGHYTETHWLPTFAWDAATSIEAAEAGIRS